MKKKKKTQGMLNAWDVSIVEEDQVRKKTSKKFSLGKRGADPKGRTGLATAL